MKGSILPQGNSFKVNYYFKGKRITGCFKAEQDAEIFRAGLMVKESEGTLDPRDYRADNPLGFANMAKKFLHSKRLLKGVKKYEQRLRFGIQEWGNRNIKHIGFGEINELIIKLGEAGYSSKYVKDIRDIIKSYYLWLWNTGEIKYDQIPKFPTVKYSMAYRNVITKKQQGAILNQIKKDTLFNPRIYIGIRFLTTYINVRPSELISIREKDIDLDNQRILIRGKYVKTGEPKYIYLLAADISLLESCGTSFGNLRFFRHIKGRGGNQPNSKFGKGYLYKWWKKACGNLGITGVDLYGGTRHSSAIDLRKRHSPEAVKRATQHKNNEAFDRYLQVTGDELRELYADTRTKVVEIRDGNKKNTNG